MGRINGNDGDRGNNRRLLHLAIVAGLLIRISRLSCDVPTKNRINRDKRGVRDMKVVMAKPLIGGSSDTS